MGSDSYAQEVVRIIAKALDCNKSPWWSPLPYNPTTKLFYKGINNLILSANQINNDLSNLWATKWQWKKFDCSVQDEKNFTNIYVWRNAYRTQFLQLHNSSNLECRTKIILPKLSMDHFNEQMDINKIPKAETFYEQVELFVGSFKLEFDAKSIFMLTDMVAGNLFHRLNLKNIEENHDFMHKKWYNDWKSMIANLSNTSLIFKLASQAGKIVDKITLDKWENRNG